MRVFEKIKRSFRGSLAVRSRTPASRSDEIKRLLGAMLREVMPLDRPRGLQGAHVDVWREIIVFEVESPFDRDAVGALVRRLPKGVGVIEEPATRRREQHGGRDIGAGTQRGHDVEAQTVLLRLPTKVIDQLSRQAEARHLSHASYMQTILEHVAHSGVPSELAEIVERLERIERAVTRSTKTS